jgi:hypothetical protein
VLSLTIGAGFAEVDLEFGVEVVVLNGDDGGVPKEV